MCQVKKIYTVIADSKSLNFPELKAGVLPVIVEGAKNCFKNFIAIKSIEIDNDGYLTAVCEVEFVGECRMTLPKSLLITIGSIIVDELPGNIVEVYAERSFIYTEVKNSIEIKGKILPLRF